MYFDCPIHGRQELTPFQASRPDLHRCPVCDLLVAVPPRFEGASLLDFDPIKAEEVRKYLKTFGNMLLLGPVGTGKTHMAWAIALERAMQHKATKYTTVRDMSQAIMRDRSAQDYIKPEFLIIDEIGRGYETPAEEQRLFEVVDKRYQQIKPTVFISNAVKQQFREKVGEAIADRISENVTILTFKGKSRRAA